MWEIKANIVNTLVRWLHRWDVQLSFDALLTLSSLYLNEPIFGNETDKSEATAHRCAILNE